MDASKNEREKKKQNKKEQMKKRKENSRSCIFLSDKLLRIVSVIVTSGSLKAHGATVRDLGASLEVVSFN